MNYPEWLTSEELEEYKKMLKVAQHVPGAEEIVAEEEGYIFSVVTPVSFNLEMLEILEEYCGPLLLGIVEKGSLADEEAELRFPLFVEVDK